MVTFEAESGKQIEFPETYADLDELLKSNELSRTEKRNIEFAWFMRGELLLLEYEKQMKAEANGESADS